MHLHHFLLAITCSWLTCLQVYSVQDSPLCLTGTAEVPLGAVFMDQTVEEQQLPIKMAGFGHCFRTEAGAGGEMPCQHGVTKHSSYRSCKFVKFQESYRSQVTQYLNLNSSTSPIVQACTYSGCNVSASKNPDWSLVQAAASEVAEKHLTL